MALSQSLFCALLATASRIGLGHMGASVSLKTMRKPFLIGHRVPPESSSGKCQMRLYPHLISAFMIGLVSGSIGSIAFMAHQAKQPDIQSGSDIFSIVDDEVMSVSFKTDTTTVIAQRSKQADRFAVQATFTDGRHPQQCLSSPNLAGQLPLITSAHAKRSLSLEKLEEGFPTRLGMLAIQSNMINDESASVEVWANAKGTLLAIRYFNQGIEVTNHIDAFRVLSNGCTSLGTK